MTTLVVTEEFNVRLDAPLGTGREAFEQGVTALGGRILLAFRRVPWVTVEMPAGVSQQILSLPHVEGFEPDTDCQWCAPLASHDVEESWPSHMIRADLAHQTTRGRGARVAIIDTGISMHPELAGAHIYVEESFVPHEDALDRNGHGTATAGLIAAQGISTLGVAPEALILVLKALNARGHGRWSWVAQALERAADLHADVVLMALGGHDISMLVEESIRVMTRSGGVVVVAAGNTPRPMLDFPGASSLVIAVAAVDRRGNVASFSSWAPWPSGPDIAAPGVSIPTISNDGGYQQLSGTSMAAAIAAGALALLYAVHPGIRAASRGGEEALVEEIRRRLRATALQLTTSPARVGYGLIDAYGLVLQVAATAAS